jgi:hypothetical protein
MLKVLTLAGILLLMVQSQSAPKPTAPAPAGVKSQSEDAQPRATPSRAPKSSDQNQSQSVNVVSLPEVSIAKNYRWPLGILYDWGPWIFTCLLVIVGGLQVQTMRQQSELLEATREQIEKQAGYMKDQSDILTASVAVAKESAEAALLNAKATERSVQVIVDKERARIQIEPRTFIVDEPKPELGRSITAKVQVVNNGETKAFISRKGIDFKITDSPSCPSSDDGKDYGFEWIGNLMEPNGVAIEQAIPAWGLPLDFVKDLQEDKAFAHLYGFIEYETLGEVWRNEFRYTRRLYMTSAVFRALAEIADDVSGIAGEESLQYGHWEENPPGGTREYKKQKTT